MATTIEERKDELVDRLAEEASNKVGPQLSERPGSWCTAISPVSPDDILYTPQETLLGQALSLWQFGAQRNPGAAKIRIFNPSLPLESWTLDHTVIEIVNDDRPSWWTPSPRRSIGRAEHSSAHPSHRRRAPRLRRPAHRCFTRIRRRQRSIPRHRSRTCTSRSTRRPSRPELDALSSRLETRSHRRAGLGH